MHIPSEFFYYVLILSDFVTKEMLQEVLINVIIQK